MYEKGKNKNVMTDWEIHLRHDSRQITASSVFILSLFIPISHLPSILPLIATRLSCHKYCLYWDTLWLKIFHCSLVLFRGKLMKYMCFPVCKHLILVYCPGFSHYSSKSYALVVPSSFRITSSTKGSFNRKFHSQDWKLREVSLIHKGNNNQCSGYSISQKLNFLKILPPSLLVLCGKENSLISCLSALPLWPKFTPQMPWNIKEGDCD